ncbi:hypothetical protein [Phenylobacterium sp.]|uniref:hypothetical protein n=1 Tax=Phenylobacterium sp. TaxID=1871053 RepID=UPI0035AF3F67
MTLDSEWRIEEIANYQGQAHLVGACIVNDAVMIAEIRGAIKIDGRDWEPNLAPARVIAAAPDLLRACKAMVEAYREEVDDDDEPSVVRQALAAIAKAEGRWW